ncbi:MAG TPA: hypothetical protein DCM40_13280, partial [Maribacter sp.]|nr:hypothetical protein [Maribacter sp.]
SGFEGDEAIDAPAAEGGGLEINTEIIKKVIKKQQAVKSPVTDVKVHLQLPSGPSTEIRY